MRCFRCGCNCCGHLASLAERHFTRGGPLTLERRGPPRATGSPAMKFEVQLEGSSGKRTRIVDLERDKAGWHVLLDSQPVEADPVELSSNTFSILLNGKSYEMRVTPAGDGRLKVQASTQEFVVE